MNGALALRVQQDHQSHISACEAGPHKARNPRSDQLFRQEYQALQGVKSDWQFWCRQALGVVVNRPWCERPRPLAQRLQNCFRKLDQYPSSARTIQPPPDHHALITAPKQSRQGSKNGGLTFTSGSLAAAEVGCGCGGPTADLWTLTGCLR